MGLCGQLVLLAVVGATFWGLDQVRPKNDQIRGRPRAKALHDPVVPSPNRSRLERIPTTVETDQRVERAVDQYGNPCLTEEYKEERAREYRCRATAAIEGLGSESCGITCAIEVTAFSGAFALFSSEAPVVTQLAMFSLIMGRMQLQQVLGISQADIRLAELEKSVSVLQIRVDTFQTRVDALTMTLTMTNTTVSPTTDLVVHTTSRTPAPDGETWLSYTSSAVIMVTAIVTLLILVRVCKMKTYTGLPAAPQAMHMQQMQPIYNP